MLTELFMESLRLTLFLLGPPLIALTLVGLTSGIIQASTQINDQALSFLPKLATAILVVVYLAPLSYELCLEFNQTIWETILRLQHGLGPA